MIVSLCRLNGINPLRFDLIFLPSLNNFKHFLFIGIANDFTQVNERLKANGQSTEVQQYVVYRKGDNLILSVGYVKRGPILAAIFED